MNSPYATPRPRLSDDDRAAWAAYEAANRAAHEQYKAMPVSYHQAGPAHPCWRCSKPTKAKGRVCKPCRIGEGT